MNEEFADDLKTLESFECPTCEATTAACGPAYPSAFPVDCIKGLIENMRAGTVAQNHKVCVKHAYTILGYGLFVTVGEPDVEPVFDSDEHAAQVKAIPWALLISIALKLIEKFAK